MKMNNSMKNSVLEEIEIQNIFDVIDPEIVSPEQDANPDLFIEGITVIVLPEKENIVSDEEYIQSAQYMISTFGVNKSPDVRNVRSGPGTNYSVIAQITVTESFVFTGNKNVVSGYDWWEILIITPSGSYVRGWYQGATGLGFWSNNSLGSGSKSGNGFSHNYDIFKVVTATQIHKLSSEFPNSPHTTLSAGDLVYGMVKSGGYMASAGRSGAEDFMEVWGWKKGSSESWAYGWMTTDQNGNSTPSMFYVDTQLKHGFTHIKGNW